MASHEWEHVPLDESDFESSDENTHSLAAPPALRAPHTSQLVGQLLLASIAEWPGHLVRVVSATYGLLSSNGGFSVRPSSPGHPGRRAFHGVGDVDAISVGAEDYDFSRLHFEFAKLEPIALWRAYASMRNIRPNGRPNCSTAATATRFAGETGWPGRVGS